MSKSNRTRSYVFTLNNPQKNNLNPDVLLEKVKKIENLRFITFQWEIGQKEQTDHFQGYLELKQPKTFKSVNRDFFDNLAWLAYRRGTQQQAIDYANDKTKKLVLPQTFQWGNKPRIYHKINQSNLDIPYTEDEQLLHIKDQIISKKYKSLVDVEKDYPIHVIKKKRLIQEMFMDYNKLDHSEISPADIYWIYGPSGCGKSCFNEQLYLSLGYQGTEVTYLKSDNETISWFQFQDENKKVLIIEEVRPEWPKYNSLINWVDKRTFLRVKGSHIRNNFELIIINSLLNPLDLFLEAAIPERNIIEPLRRIYSGHVLKITKNKQLFISLKNKLDSGSITKKDFKQKLIPLIEEITIDHLPDNLKKHFE